ncbi:MAG: hypothetical protein C5B47_01460 [Verrucomicrobia bacterium]|nr:MAG: hypothetical protein C5B47_01460 [Verrucomicrobiota bacterium]
MFLNYPVGAFNSHWFQFFNALSFQIMMGAPVILFAKSLGASSTILGVIAAFTPLMTMFQLAGARKLEKHGYRGFVLMGWGTRTIFIFIVAAVPLMNFLETNAKLFVLVGALLIYNCLRGIASAGWLPWMTALIPEESRGRFLSLDQLFQYIGSLISVSVSGFLMHGKTESWEFVILFFLSALNAIMSLLFIRRIPDVQRSETLKKSAAHVPWAAMLGYAPFHRLVIFNLIYAMMTGGMGAFTVEYLHMNPKFNISLILYLSSVAFIGSMLWFTISVMVIDHLSAQVIFRVAMAVFSLVMIGWLLLSAEVIPGSIALVALLNFCAGFATAAFNLANAHISMSLMPEMGRNHFFALFSVITNLGLGAAPILWGMSLDFLGRFELVTGVFHWQRHSMYFLLLFCLSLIALLYISRLRDQHKNLNPG